MGYGMRGRMLSLNGFCGLAVLLCLVLQGAGRTEPSSGGAVQLQTGGGRLAVEGVVTQRNEIWDRRTNPLMGRPDILKEIRFAIRVIRVQSGRLPAGCRSIAFTVKDHEKIIAFKRIMKGDSGIFRFSVDGRSYELLKFEPRTGSPNPVNTVTARTQVIRPEATGTDPGAKENDRLRDLETISGATIRTSASLRERIVRRVAEVYGMKDASMVTMVSYSGPMPPDGGYFYWGVKGLIDGKWYLWQRGNKGRLREGGVLDDPHKYQKCNAPDMKISTPLGPVEIRFLKEGDLVLSDAGAAVRILKTVKTAVTGHQLCRVTLANGAVLEVSPAHPAVGGRPVGDFAAGEKLDGIAILTTELVPDRFGYTCDILPDSAEGSYFVSGVRLWSTLGQAGRRR